MPRFQVGVTIKKHIDTVYQAYTDPENMLIWSRDLEKFEVIKGEFGEIGSVAHLHYNQNGRKNIVVDRLEYLDPGNKIIARISVGGLTARVETTFKSSDNKTEVLLKWDGRGKNLLVMSLLPLLIRKIKKRAQSELDTFKELAEKYGIKFQK